MISNIIIVSGLFVFLSAIIIWSFYNLPKEKYQFIAAVPSFKTHEKWVGVNYTFYGLISASAAALGVTIFYLLMILPGYSSIMIIAVLLPIFMSAIASAKILASLVEKKKNVLSVGAALFTAFLISPIVTFAVNKYMSPFYGKSIDFIFFLTSASVSFLFGEGMGRLACVSFGCCYGKQVKTLKGVLYKIFSVFFIRFTGDTKKISYASNLQGKKIVPIQIITAFIYIFSGSLCMYLLLDGRVMASFLISSLCIFVWRLLSEFLRCDYRGGGKISVYQIFSVISIFLVILISFTCNIFSYNDSQNYEIYSAILKLWDPAYILMIQGLWIFCFIYTGKSQVTGSKIRFHINENEI